MRAKILPSLLAADFGHLEREVQRVEAAGADALHLDVMDAHFVPNLSIGPQIVAMARRVAGLPLSVHLMMEHPQSYLRVFAEAGADSLLIHVEAHCDVRRTLQDIRALGMRPGLTLNPRTPARAARPYLAQAAEILCMTVQPGYGGQSFMPSVLDKIDAIRQADATLDLMVDGGIQTETAAACAARGANLFVAGTSLFRATDMRSAIDSLRNAAQRSLDERT